MTPATRGPAQRAELEAFSRRLVDLMHRAGMSQSDLARALWGTTTDARGRDVARNRDRISHYVKGDQMPEPKTLRLLAKSLGVDVTELSPSIHTAATARAPEVSLTNVPGQHDKMHLTVNTVLPTEIAIRVAGIIGEARASKTDGNGR